MGAWCCWKCSTCAAYIDRVVYEQSSRLDPAEGQLRPPLGGLALFVMLGYLFVLSLALWPAAAFEVKPEHLGLPFHPKKRSAAFLLSGFLALLFLVFCPSHTLLERFSTFIARNDDRIAPTVPPPWLASSRMSSRFVLNESNGSNSYLFKCLGIE